MALLTLLVISVGGIVACNAIVNAISHVHLSSQARARVLTHYCSPTKTGAVNVHGQIANDGKTDKIQAQAYVLTDSGEKINASAGWDAFAGNIDGGGSDFYSATVPIPPGATPVGCGVLLGEGAPKGVTYVGDGANSGS